MKHSVFEDNFVLPTKPRGHVCLQSPKVTRTLKEILLRRATVEMDKELVAVCTAGICAKRETD